MIPPEDLLTETFPIRGIHHQGGQKVGVHSGVRVTHKPTGIMAYVDSGRSQHTNRLLAVDMILAAITHPKF